MTLSFGKRQLTEWGNGFTNYTSDRVLISKYPKYIKTPKNYISRKQVT